MTTKAKTKKSSNVSAIFLATSFAAAALTSGCGSPSEESSELKIVGGTVVASGDLTAARTATVALSNEEMFAKGKSFCTSTLIGSNILLTAAHCVTDENGKISLEPILAVFELEVGKDVSLARRVRAIAVHKDYNSNIVGTKDPSVFAAHDVAVLALEGNAPEPYVPVQVIASNASYKFKQEVLLAGFGVTATRTVNTTGKLRAVKATIENEGNTGNILLLRGPKLNAKAIDYDEAGKPKIVQANGGACAGDSGGPAYIRNSDGKYKVVGATSYGSELRLSGRLDPTRYCVGENGFVDLRKYAAGISNASQVLNDKSAAASKMSLWRFTNVGTLASTN